jgi:two-component system sensor histidine kinase VicK
MVVMYLILVFVVMASCGTFTVVVLRFSEERTVRDRLSQAADMIKGAVIDELPEDGFQQQLFYLARPQGDEYYILDAEGRTIATNAAVSPLIVGQYKNSVIIGAMAGEETFSAGRIYPDQEDAAKRWMEYARPVTARLGTEYILYLRSDAQDIYNSIWMITVIFLMGLLIALALAVILGIFFAGTVNKPIVLLTKKAKDYARGDLNEAVSVHSNDEIGQLTESFNHMAGELSQTLSVIESEKNKLEIVLHNVTDGVMAYDTRGRLIHANQICEELLGIRGIDGISLKEMLVRLNLKTVTGEGGAQTIPDSVLPIDGRFINVVCNYYRGSKGEAGGVVLLLQDLTKHIMLENMRKEFVANVSHELRTPLTTIKSYAETLLDEIPAEAGLDGHFADFLATINGETDRMTILVNDLLELSRLDNKQLDFNLQTVNLCALLAQNVAKHRHTLENMGSSKTVIYNEPGFEAFTEADHERISQVFNNIITNSLRYSGDNAVVEVSLEDAGDVYRVSIKDNGMGIPAEDLDRIFERFYRVDKARSRELGGTGLGLSISKEIIEAHGGNIYVYSEVGVGTTMIVELLKSEEDRSV